MEGKLISYKNTMFAIIILLALVQIMGGKAKAECISRGGECSSAKLPQDCCAGDRCVRKDALSGTCQEGWKRAMLIALSAKNKVGFVDGSIPRPAITAPNARYWQRCNDIVFSWILNNVSPEISRSIIYSKSAYAAWLELNERFGQSNGAQLYGIQKKLNDFTQGNDSIASYYTKLKTIWDEMEGMDMNPVCPCNCHCGSKVKQMRFQENQRAVQFLMGLNDSYNTIRGTILLQNPLPKVNVIYNNLLQEEGQREIHAAVQFQPESAALYARNFNQRSNNQGNTNSQNGGNSSYNNNGYRRNNNYNGGSNGNNGNNGYRGRNFNPNYNQGSGSLSNNNNVVNSQRNQNQGYQNQRSNISNNNADQSQKQQLYCLFCQKSGHKTDECRHLMNRNRRFAGNAFTDQGSILGPYDGNNGDQNSGMDMEHNSLHNSSNGPASSANFAGLFQEALGPW